MAEAGITKKAIVQQFKQLMQEKPFEKISVSDITTRCGINRLTFYYYFQDKYELVNYIYYTEVHLSMLENFHALEDWSPCFCQLLTSILKEKAFYRNAFAVKGENVFTDYIFSLTKSTLIYIFGTFFTSTIKTKEEVEFTADFFACGIVGAIARWATDGMQESPQLMTSRLGMMVKSLLIVTQKK
ncbi:MAG: TetR/AcrR family transcriptional regulator C-terminal domain-containing protein [Clostridia bacterium]|nr:TetR/AcrR family transcriptional regulator C-terminal domain-containing protein [Clostridia bacterium]